MWLLKFHVAFSVLCFITIIGFRNVYKQTLTDNGWVRNEKKKSDIRLFMNCLVPLMNVLIVITILSMIYMEKSEFDEFYGVRERKGEDNEKTGERGA